jgi:hypothetical protein
MTNYTRWLFKSVGIVSTVYSLLDLKEKYKVAIGYRFSIDFFCRSFKNFHQEKANRELLM